MGANISMDVSAGVDAAAQSEFEDKLRQEVVLVPEDLADIHIQAPADADADAPADAPAATSVVTGHTPPRKRNLKKKGQAQGAGAAAAANTVPFQTERTIEQRREQVRPIIDKLTELQMNVSYPAIRELYKQLSQFIKTGEDMKIKIPFPEFSRKIKGELTNATYKPCWVKLEME